MTLLCSTSADSTLINGKGRTTSTDGADAELTVFNVTQGSRYRFRLVSMSCDPNHVFSIDGHNMTVIEVDSVNHEPVTVDSIQIYAGQRYSFIVRLHVVHSMMSSTHSGSVPVAQRHRRYRQLLDPRSAQHRYYLD